MTDLDRQLGFTPRNCTCDVMTRLHAVLEDREMEPCPAHQPDELAARRLAKERRDREIDAERLHQAHEARVARDTEEAAARRRAEAAEAREAALNAMEPVVADLYRLTNAPIVPAGTAIGDDSAFLEGLGRMFGIPAESFNEHPNHDDAA